MATNITSLFDIRQELVNRLRNADLLSIATRGVTTTTENLVASLTGTETFALTNTYAKNIRNIDINSSPAIFGTDYTIDLNAATVDVNVTSGDTVDITYDYGSDRIYRDFPQPHHTIKDFPRVGFDVIAGTTTELELGAGTTETEYVVSINAYHPDQDELEKLITSIRTFLIDSKKTFFYIPFMTLTATGPVLISPFGKHKIMQRNQDALIKFVHEN